MDPIPRPMMYRQAGRTLRYRAYVLLEVLWTVTVLIAAGNQLFFPSITSLGWMLTVVLISTSILHSMRMTVTQPWHLLKAVLFGALLFGVGYGLRGAIGFPADPVLSAVLFASAFYLWQGEQWTIELAQSALATPRSG